MPYYFLDYDEETGEERDISAADYCELIDLCFRYSAFFSLSRGWAETDMSKLPVRAAAHLPECRTLTTKKDLFVFACTAETKVFLLSCADSVFSWANWGESRNMPEDLCFYRRDGSVFFWSESHEGVCVLANRPDEALSDLPSKEKWRYFDLSEASGNIWIPDGLADYRLPILWNF